MGAIDEMSGQDYWDCGRGPRLRRHRVTRRYYISAEEVAWDYAPSGRNLITGKPFDEVADVFVRRGP